MVLHMGFGAWASGGFQGRDLGLGFRVWALRQGCTGLGVSEFGLRSPARPEP